MSYALTLEAGEAEGGVHTGLYALDTDAATGQGKEILLSQDASGVVSGKVGGVTYFTIELKDGKITLDQKDERAIWHEKGSDADEAANLHVKNGSLKLTVTITDGDGDTASHSVDLALVDKGYP